MITVTRLNNKTFSINAHMIEAVEEMPDTVITLYTDKKYIVKESLQEITDKIINYNRKIFQLKYRVE